MGNLSGALAVFRVLVQPRSLLPRFVVQGAPEISDLLVESGQLIQLAADLRDLNFQCLKGLSCIPAASQIADLAFTRPRRHWTRFRQGQLSGGLFVTYTAHTLCSQPRLDKTAP